MPEQNNPKDTNKESTKPQQNNLQSIGEILGDDPKFSGNITGARSKSESIPDALDVTTDPSDYRPYTGSNINPLLTDINKQRAQEQSNWQKLGRSAIQMGAEITGGSVEGAGYILNIPQQITDLVRGEEVKLSNSIADLGRNIREGSREEFAIYEEDPGSFSPGDFGWWAKNGVSIVSTLSLALPATAATKAVGGAGRAIGNISRALAGLDKAKKGQMLTSLLGAEKAARASAYGTTLAQASFSRHAENLMEGAPLFEEKYEEYLEKGLPDELAREKAGEAAAASYKLNSAFLLQDIGTFGLLNKASRALRGSRSVSRGAQEASESMPGWGKSILEMGTEGVEEAYQYAVEKEAGNVADVSAGVKDPSKLTDRVGNYMNGEMATGAFFGALGSGLFRAVGSRVDAWNKSNEFQEDLQQTLEEETRELGRDLTPQEEKDITEQKAKEFTRKKATINANFTNASELIDEQVQQRHAEGDDVSGLMGLKAITNAVKQVAVTGENLQSVDSLLGMNEEDFDNAFEGDPPITKSDLEDYKSVIDTIPNLYQSNKRQYPEVAAEITRHQAAVKFRNTRNKKKGSAITEAINDIDGYQQLTKKGQDMAEREVRMRSLKKAISTLKKQEKEGDTDNSQSIDFLQNRLDKETKIQKREKSKERKTEDELNDQDILQSIESDVESLSSDRADLAISQAVIDETSQRIKELKDTNSKKTEDKKKYRDEKRSSSRPSSSTASSSSQSQPVEKLYRKGDVDTKISANPTKDNNYKVSVDTGDGSTDVLVDDATSAEDAVEKGKEKYKNKLQEGLEKVNKEYNELPDKRASKRHELRKTRDRIQQRIDSLNEKPLGSTYINPDDMITEEVTSLDQLQDGDTIIYGDYETPIPIELDGDNLKFRHPKSNMKTPVWGLIVHEGTTVYKVTSPQQAEKDSKEDLSDEEAAEYDSKIPDDYESVSRKSSTQKTTIKSAAYMSTRNERHPNPEDPDEARRANWAESIDDVFDSSGEPKYEVEFELAEGATAESGAIRAYVVDRKSGERVSEDGGEVFFHVHEPSYTRVDQAGSGEIIQQYRQDIVNAIENGQQPVAPITDKTGGIFRFDGDRNDVKTITDNQSPQLAVLNKDGNYVGSNGVPEGFDRLGKGNTSQIGRVYTLVAGLNGMPKVLPLERDTLGDSMSSIALSIITDMINGASPGDTISSATRGRFTGRKAEALQRFFENEFGEDISNEDLLNLIVLDGPITEKVKNPDQKRLHVDFKRNMLKYGAKRASFKEFINDNQVKSDVLDFLKERRHNIVKDHLSNPDYRDLLLNEEVLYQTNKLPLLIQPTIKFGDVQTKEGSVNASLENSGVVEQLVDYDGSKYMVNVDGDKASVHKLRAEKKQGLTVHGSPVEIDPLSKEGRSVLAELPESLLNNLTIPETIENLDNEESTEQSSFFKRQIVQVDPQASGFSDGDSNGRWIIDEGPTEYPDGRIGYMLKRSLDDNESLEAFEEDLLQQDRSIEDQTIDEELAEEPSDQSEPDPVDSDSLEESFGDLFQQRVSLGLTKGLKPVLEGLKRRLGIPYVMVNSEETEWAGLYDNGVIFINTAKAGDDTPFHEYAHPVIRQIRQNSPILYASLISEIKSDSQYRRIYEKVKRNYPEHSSEQLTEEALVQIIGERASTSPQTQGAIRRLWNKIKDYIKALFTSVDVDNLDESTSIQDIAELLRGQQFIDVNVNPMAAYQKVDESMTYNEYNSWINSMIYALINDSNVTSYKDADKLDFGKLYDRLSKLQQSSGNQSLKRILDNMFDDGIVNRESDWYRAINDKLAKFDIKPEQDRNGETFDDETSYDFQPDYYFSGKDKTSTFIKMIFSTIPKVEKVITKKDNDGNAIRRKKFHHNRYTGMPEFHSFNDIWNRTNKLLSDIVEGVDEDGNHRDIFDQFMEKLSENKHLHPELEVVIERLQDAPDWKKAKFVNTFYKANQNYSMMIYDGKFKLIKNQPTSVEIKVATRWREKFEDLWVDQEGNINSERQKQLKEKYDKFVDDWTYYYNRFGNKGGQIRSEHIKKFREILAHTGLNISEKGVDYLLTNFDGGKKKALNYYIKEEGLNRILSARNGLFTLSNNQGDTFIEDQQAAEKFIEAVASFNQDLGTPSVFGPDNNTYYNYSNYSMMGKLLEYYKANSSELERLKELPFYQHSKWAEHIDDLHITNNMSFRRKGANGKKMKALGNVDRVIVDINKTLQGQFSMLARGANATEFNITGAPVEKSYSSQQGQVILSTKASKELAGYVHDEIVRIRETKEFIKKHGDDPSKMIEGYHTEVRDPDTEEMYTPALRMFLMDGILDNLNLPENISRESFINRAEVQREIKKEFQKRVNDLRKFFEDNDFSSEELKDYITPDKDHYKKTSNEVSAMLYDYMFNGMVANLEQQKLFAADIAMFENPANLQKRILANGSMGQPWYLRKGEKPTFTSSVIKDFEYDSDTHESLKGINITDAQAWVSLEYYADALRAFAKMTPEIEQAIENIQSGNYRQQDVKALMNQMKAGPLKTVHFERVIQDGILRPVYDKQTILPLIPPVIEGSSLENLDKAMKDQGIDHVVVESGKKLGRITPTEAFDENGRFKEDITLHSTVQNRKYTFLQTEMPAKGIHSFGQGSQQKYNIISDLDPDFTHDGKRVIDTIHHIQGAISDVSTQQLLDQVMTDGQVDKDKLYNKLIDLETTSGEIDRNLVDYLEQRLPIEAMPAYNYSLQNSIMSLLKKTGATVEHTTGFRGIQAASVGFDQLSESQYSDITWLDDDPQFKPPRLEDGKLKKGQILLPHSILREYDLDPNNPADREAIKYVVSGVAYRIPNQSISNIGMIEAIGILPEYMNDTVVPYREVNEQMGTDNDGDKLDLLLYNYTGRDKPERVKYWTESKGDRTLLEIYKYRSEVLGENLPDKDEFVEKYRDQHVLLANSKQGLENYLLDMYEVVFSNEDAFDRSMSSLEDTAFEDLITSHPNFEGRSMNNLQVVSPFHQAMVRDSFINANSGVGQVSNHIIDHTKSQYKNIYALTSKGAPFKVPGVQTNTTTVTSDGKAKQATLFDEVNNVDGERISKILSMIMDAQVDAEKDDYAPRGNFNTETNSVALAMVRAGVPLKDIVDTIGSNIVRSYSKYKMASRNTFSQFRGNAFEKALIENGYKAEVESVVDGKKQVTVVADVEGFKESTPKSNPLKVYRNFERLSSGLSESIQKTRFTVNGGGSSFASAIAYEMFKNEPVEQLANVDDKFDAGMLGENSGASMEQKAYENVIQKGARQLFENQSIAFGDSFHRVLNQLKGVTQFEPINLISGDTSAVENVYFEFYSYIMSSAFSDVNREDLIKGDNTLAQRLRTYGKRNRLIDSYLIPTKVGALDFVQTSNATRVDTDLGNIFRESWEDMYKDDPELALDLARYAYFQSGFKRNMHSFHEFIPPIINKELGIVERFSELQAEDAFDGFVDQYIRHNTEDNSLAPLVRPGRTPGVKSIKDRIVLNKKNSDLLSAEGRPLKFIKRRMKTPMGSTYYNLYELVRTKENNLIYRKTPKLGYNERGNRYYEYDLNNRPQPIFNKVEYPTVGQTTQPTNTQGSQMAPDDNWKSQENHDENPMDNCKGK